MCVFKRESMCVCVSYMHMRVCFGPRLVDVAVMGEWTSPGTLRVEPGGTRSSSQKPK